MISIQNKLRHVRETLLTVSEKVYHYRRPKDIKTGYIVWAEDSEDGSLSADNWRAEQQIHGTIDYFTLIEFDETVDAIQEALDNSDDLIGWNLAAVSYEDETNLIHYEWDFWVA